MTDAIQAATRTTETFRPHVDETSLARVWQHVSGRTASGGQAALLTAFRPQSEVAGETGSPEQALGLNRKRNRQLMADVRALGYGYSLVTGYWDEGDGEATPEESLLVTPRAHAPNFKDDMVKLGAKYDQDGVFVQTPLVDPESGHLNLEAGVYDKEGAKFMSLSRFSPTAIEPAYTRLRGGPRDKDGRGGRAFTFAEAVEEGAPAVMLARAALADGVAPDELAEGARVALERFGT